MMLSNIDQITKEILHTIIDYTAMQHFYVYFLCRDNYEKVLYIGSTTSLDARIREHKGSSFWRAAGDFRFNHVYYLTVQNFTEMTNLERELIRKYEPEMNLMYTSRFKFSTIDRKECLTDNDRKFYESMKKRHSKNKNYRGLRG